MRNTKKRDADRCDFTEVVRQTVGRRVHSCDFTLNVFGIQLEDWTAHPHGVCPLEGTVQRPQLFVRLELLLGLQDALFVLMRMLMLTVVFGFDTAHSMNMVSTAV